METHNTDVLSDDFGKTDITAPVPAWILCMRMPCVSHLECGGSCFFSLEKAVRTAHVHDSIWTVSPSRMGLYQAQHYHHVDIRLYILTLSVPVKGDVVAVSSRDSSGKVIYTMRNINICIDNIYGLPCIHIDLDQLYCNKFELVTKVSE